MKVTQKEVERETTVQRGSGFNPKYQFSYKGFVKPYTTDKVFDWRDYAIATARTKREFVREVTKLINK